MQMPQKGNTQFRNPYQKYFISSFLKKETRNDRPSFSQDYRIKFREILNRKQSSRIILKSIFRFIEHPFFTRRHPKHSTYLHLIEKRKNSVTFSFFFFSTYLSLFEYLFVYEKYLLIRPKIYLNKAFGIICPRGPLFLNRKKLLDTLSQISARISFLKFHEIFSWQTFSQRRIFPKMIFFFVYKTKKYRYNIVK